MASQIRTIALAIVRRGDDILVYEGYDPPALPVFYRPLGGGVDFGEPGHEAVVRELREEIGASIVEPRHLGTLENLFHYRGEARHEMVLVYEGKLAEEDLYACERMEGVDNVEGRPEPFPVLWMPLEAFRSGKATLCPKGLLQLLDGAR